MDLTPQPGHHGYKESSPLLVLPDIPLPDQIRNEKEKVLVGKVEPLKVCLRLKPSAQGDSIPFRLIDEYSVGLRAPPESNTFRTSGDTEHIFQFSRVFDGSTTQEDLFKATVFDSVSDFCGGKNFLLFSYGVTGSGKTHTIQGTNPEWGLLPRSLELCFDRIGDQLMSDIKVKPELVTKVRVLSNAEQEKERNKKAKLLELCNSKPLINTSVFTQNSSRLESEPRVPPVPSSLPQNPSSISSLTNASSGGSLGIGGLSEDITSSRLSIDSLGTSSMISSARSIISSAPSDMTNPDDILGDIEANQYQFCLWVSFIEIYNELIYDLLMPLPDKKGNNFTRKSLSLGVDKKRLPYVKDLRWVPIENVSEVMKLLEFGQRQLHLAATKLNQFSSRSHCVFTIKMIRMMPHAKTGRVSMLTLCDLAGSERISKSKVVGQHLVEAGQINKSLYTFGRCIEIMRNNQDATKAVPAQMIPYRDSKLTHLFQSYFNGNSSATMIVNVSTVPSLFDETLHALRFSAIAKQIEIKTSENSGGDVVFEEEDSGANTKTKVNRKRRLIETACVNSGKQGSKARGLSVFGDNLAPLPRENKNISCASPRKIAELRKKPEVVSEVSPFSEKDIFSPSTTADTSIWVSYLGTPPEPIESIIARLSGTPIDRPVSKVTASILDSSEDESSNSADEIEDCEAEIARLKKEISDKDKAFAKEKRMLDWKAREVMYEKIEEIRLKASADQRAALDEQSVRLHRLMDDQLESYQKVQQYYSDNYKENIKKSWSDEKKEMIEEIETLTRNLQESETQNALLINKNLLFENTLEMSKQEVMDAKAERDTMEKDFTLMKSQLDDKENDLRQMALTAEEIQQNNETLVSENKSLIDNLASVKLSCGSELLKFKTELTELQSVLFSTINERDNAVRKRERICVNAESQTSYTRTSSSVAANQDSFNGSFQSTAEDLIEMDMEKEVAPASGDIIPGTQALKISENAVENSEKTCFKSENNVRPQNHCDPNVLRVDKNFTNIDRRSQSIDHVKFTGEIRQLRKELDEAKHFCMVFELQAKELRSQKHELLTKFNRISATKVALQREKEDLSIKQQDHDVVVEGLTSEITSLKESASNAAEIIGTFDDRLIRMRESLEEALEVAPTQAQQNGQEIDALLAMLRSKIANYKRRLEGSNLESDRRIDFLNCQVQEYKSEICCLKKQMNLSEISKSLLQKKMKENTNGNEENENIEAKVENDIVDVLKVRVCTTEKQLFETKAKFEQAVADISVLGDEKGFLENQIYKLQQESAGFQSEISYKERELAKVCHLEDSNSRLMDQVFQAEQARLSLVSQIQLLASEKEAASRRVAGLELDLAGDGLVEEVKMLRGENSRLTEALSGLAAEKNILSERLGDMNRQVESFQKVKDRLNCKIDRLNEEKTLADGLRDQAKCEVDEIQVKCESLESEFSKLKGKFSLISSERDEALATIIKYKETILLLEESGSGLQKRVNATEEALKVAEAACISKNDHETVLNEKKHLENLYKLTLKKLENSEKNLAKLEKEARVALETSETRIESLNSDIIRLKKRKNKLAHAEEKGRVALASLKEEYEGEVERIGVEIKQNKLFIERIESENRMLQAQTKERKGVIEDFEIKMAASTQKIKALEAACKAATDGVAKENKGVAGKGRRRSRSEDGSLVEPFSVSIENLGSTPNLSHLNDSGRKSKRASAAISDELYARLTKKTTPRSSPKIGDGKLSFPGATSPLNEKIIQMSCTKPKATPMKKLMTSSELERTFDASPALDPLPHPTSTRATSSSSAASKASTKEGKKDPMAPFLRRSSRKRNVKK